MNFQEAIYVSALSAHLIGLGACYVYFRRTRELSKLYRARIEELSQASLKGLIESVNGFVTERIEQRPLIPLPRDAVKN